MEQGSEAKPSRLERFVERLRQAPPRKQGFYALCFAALTTAVFLGLAAAWSVWVRPDGEGNGSIVEAARQVVSVVVGLFRASAPADSEL